MAKDIFINLSGYSLGIDMGREGYDETRGVIMRFDKDINGYQVISNLGAPECEIIQEMASRAEADRKRMRELECDLADRGGIVAELSKRNAELELQLANERQWREQNLSVKTNLVNTIKELEIRMQQPIKLPARTVRNASFNRGIVECERALREQGFKV